MEWGGGRRAAPQPVQYHLEAVSGEGLKVSVILQKGVETSDETPVVSLGCAICRDTQWLFREPHEMREKLPCHWTRILPHTEPGGSGEAGRHWGLPALPSQGKRAENQL